MGKGEIFWGESTRFEQGYGERITHHQRRGGTGGRCQAKRTGFFRHFHAQVNIRRARHAAFWAAGHANERNVQTFQHGDQRQYFVGFTGVGQRNDHILRRDHPEIAVRRFTWMHEERGCSGTGKGRGHFAANVTRFAHPHHHDFARTGEYFLACMSKVLINILI
ncbi:hypothetical protein D3C71_1097380 [compost metagenome]